MGQNNSWPMTTKAYVLPVLVFFYSSEAVHTMMHMTK